MFKCTEFEIGKRFKDILGSASLNRFDRLMNADLGIVVRSKRGQEVRKIEIETGHVRKLFYLKRCTSRASEAIAALWRSRELPCERELAMIRALQERDMPVMRPAAWGRRSVLGMSREGFLLVEAVDGQEVTDLFGRADRRLRLRLVRAMGNLLGQLNGLGFFQRIRLRDLICTEIPDPDRAPVQLVLIDREATRVRPQRFSTARCIDCLARCYCKLIQLRHRLDAREMSSFAGSYMAALEGRGSVRKRELINRTRRRVESLTAPGGKYQDLQNVALSAAPEESDKG